jgi:hypothetical protein
MAWTHMAQDKDKCWSLVTMVMNCQVPLNAGNFWTSCASQEGLCFMDLVIWLVSEVILVENLGTNTFPINVLALKGLPL